MLFSLRVDGFRSLVRFKLELRPGLNLLIGPNGSGKTNIISFLGFLGQLDRSDLSSIVSNLGGSGAVFRKLGANRYQSKIRAGVRGRVRPDQRYLQRSKKKVSSADEVLYFEYSFTIELSEDRESVFFGDQELRLTIYPSDEGDPADLPKKETIVAVNGNSDGSVVCSRAELAADSPKEFLRFGPEKEQSIEKAIEHQSSSYTSIVSLVFGLLPPYWALPVITDFGGGVIFNPHPSRIRLPEDSAKSPGIRPDGSGLYASLFALKRGGAPSRESPFFMLGFVQRGEEVLFVPTIKLDRLVEFFKLAYPSMLALTVSNDQFENTIRARVTLIGAERSQIPMAALSDGTLKWMAFVTAIFTNSRILAIEEPENFVHPFVQREAVRLVREQLRTDSYMFMSSHSETILNSAEPEEIIVVSSRGGRTQARRIRNPRKLREQINESGFGVGFYYLSGALEDA